MPQFPLWIHVVPDHMLVCDLGQTDALSGAEGLTLQVHHTWLSENQVPER